MHTTNMRSIVSVHERRGRERGKVCGGGLLTHTTGNRWGIDSVHEQSGRERECERSAYIYKLVIYGA